ncbi:hypothetical protein ACYSNR_14000 [Enterococcus sp. LJL128]
MERKMLIELLSETLLWETVSLHAEELERVKPLLKTLEYVDQKKAAAVNRSEVFHTDSFEVKSWGVEGTKLIMDFEMPFVLSLWQEEECLFRLSASAAGSCMIPDVGSWDWSKLDWESLDKLEMLKHAHLVDITGMRYTNVECDDISLF